MVGEACVAGAVHGREGRRGTRAGEMATEASGTHPTGMNSCLNKNRFLKNDTLHPMSKSSNLPHPSLPMTVAQLF